MKTEINFWGYKQEYYEFSNFYDAPIYIDKVLWKTSEHYFQAMKFYENAWMKPEINSSGETITLSVQEYIRKQISPKLAAREGRRKDLPLREDWDQVKEHYMYEALRAKFTQHKRLHDILLSTDDIILIEDSPIDFYWGCGKDRSGSNRLGVLLMRLRWELREMGKMTDLHNEDPRRIERLAQNPFFNYIWSNQS